MSSSLVSIFAASSLLPSIKEVEPAKAIALSQILMQITKRALFTLKKGNFSEFDAPVGDNSCKIRAAKIADIAERAQNDPIFAQEIENLLKTIAAIEKRMPAVSFEKVKNKCTLTEFRARNNLEFTLLADIHFLVQAHFLFSVKKREAYDETDPSILQKMGPIATSVAKNWIHHMKVFLAEASVSFVQQETALLGCKRKTILQKMLSPPFLKSHEHRLIAPNLHSMEVLFTRALQQKRLVVFKIAQWIDKSGEKIRQGDATFVVHPNKSMTTFIPKTVEKTDLAKPAIVIEARSVKKEGEIWDLQERFFQEDLFQIMLITAAQDPQYLGGKKIELIPFDTLKEDGLVQEEQEHFKRLNILAVEKGVACSNPAFFVIEHIFCDTVGNATKIKGSSLPTDFSEFQTSNWMGDDLNVKPGSWILRKATCAREVCY